MYSIVIPCYKSSQTIQKVVELTIEQFNNMNIHDFEFILANDCSPDDGKTLSALKILAEKYQFVKVINLGKNMGQHNAIMACLNYASGDFIIGMDDDLQTDPSQLPLLIDKINEGYDLVYGYYQNKRESLFRRIGSRLNYTTVRMLIGKPKWIKTSSFWIIRKYVKDCIIKYRSSSVHLQCVFLRATDNIACVPIEHFERAIGQSTYTFKKLVKVYSSILSYSDILSRIMITMGTILTVLGFTFSLVFTIFLTSSNFECSHKLIFSYITFLFGIIQLSIGFLEKKIEYISEKTSDKPQYIVKETWNIEDGNSK